MTESWRGDLPFTSIPDELAALRDAAAAVEKRAAAGEISQLEAELATNRLRNAYNRLALIDDCGFQRVGMLHDDVTVYMEAKNPDLARLLASMLAGVG